MGATSVARDEKGKVLPGHSLNPDGPRVLPVGLRKAFRQFCHEYVDRPIKRGGKKRVEALLDALLEPMLAQDREGGPLYLVNAEVMRKTLFGLLGYAYGLPAPPNPKKDEQSGQSAGGLTVILPIQAPCRCGHPGCSGAAAQDGRQPALAGAGAPLQAQALSHALAPDRGSNGNGDENGGESAP